MAKVVVGLGNPGPKYQRTRHNVGAEVIAELGRRHPAAEHRRNLTLETPATIAGSAVVLARPRTFMNESGPAVQSLVQRYAVRDLSDLLVVVDDMDLAIGIVRLRPSGSTGGHNGLKSIISALGSDAFGRLRVGIGRPDGGVDPIRHVLDSFSIEDRAIIVKAEQLAADAVECWVEFGAHEAMNRFNGLRIETENSA
ncbi:MAG: aminoacyl-tRNA hydrolase [Chloroflexi bacterium]|nr:aminoacyl-tRNA hydrolase [Chloroflexota bacterium]